MNTIQTVELTISSLINDLNNGLSWLRKDDNGIGSIQDKYEATEMQILTIKQHPKLINIEPIKFNFTVRDDTVPTETQKSPITGSNPEVSGESDMESVGCENTEVDIYTTMVQE